ncbi:MAG TPA: DUF3187 family protein [Devosia sp.]|nr:DUF3187 family protein [Devosia sp.]
MSLFSGSFRKLAAVQILLAVFSPPTSAKSLGPVAVRNQLPFNQLILELTPAEAETVARDTLDVEFSLGWSNTFIMSPKIGNWIEYNRDQGRSKLSLAEINQILVSSGRKDLYFFDGEVARWGLRLSYGLTDTLQLTLDTSIHSRNGGFADPLIESFHHSLNLGNADREFFPQNDFLVFLHSGEQQFYRDNRPAAFAPGDTTLELKLKSRSRWRGWTGAVAASIKAPTGNVNDFGGSGNWDGQIAGYASHPAGRDGTVHLNLSYTRLGGIDNLPIPTGDHIWSALAAYEAWSHHHKLNWVFQGAYSTSLFDGASSSDLSDATLLFTAGLRIPVDHRDLLSFALIENIGQFDNSTDIALHLSYRHSFGGKAPY